MTSTPTRGLDKPAVAEALADLFAERVRQHAAWGEQSHLPDGTGPRWRARADAARADCEAAGDAVTWRHILEEEFAEALAETDPVLLYGELTQLGALVVKWMQALRTRADLPAADLGLLAGFGRHRSIVDLHVILVAADGRILLTQRANTGYADGQWHLPSGHLEPGESLEEGARREAREELGIELGDLELVHVMHHTAPGEEPRVGFFWRTRRWQGTPVNAEPDKCSGLAWVDPSALPEPTVPYARAALAHLAAGTLLAADGFPPRDGDLR